ncbi:hypothetical protein EON67_02080 [archaeon]|nr:MAG: hypothetical protein EON67_02080 [archaeon]
MRAALRCTPGRVCVIRHCAARSPLQYRATLHVRTMFGGRCKAVITFGAVPCVARLHGSCCTRACVRHPRARKLVMLPPRAAQPCCRHTASQSPQART